MTLGPVRNADSQAQAQTHPVRISEGGPVPWVLTSLWWDSSACFSGRVVTVKTSRCLGEEVRETWFRGIGSVMSGHLVNMSTNLSPLSVVTVVPHHELSPHWVWDRKKDGSGRTFFPRCSFFHQGKNLFWSRPVGLFLSSFYHNLVTRPFPDLSQAIV